MTPDKVDVVAPKAILVVPIPIELFAKFPLVIGVPLQVPEVIVPVFGVITNPLYDVTPAKVDVVAPKIILVVPIPMELFDKYAFVIAVPLQVPEVIVPVFGVMTKPL